MKHGRDDARFEAKIKAAEPFAQPILRHLRALVHEACPGVRETVKWGHLCFEREAIICMIGAFRQHCAFRFWHGGMRAVLAEDGVTELSAMSSFGRITRVADLPSDRKMLGYLRHAVALAESGVPARRRRPTRVKPETKVPAELAAALKANPVAAATFAKLSPGGRRDYVDWIGEAKREATRSNRLATTVAWLAEGKARDWKYAAG